MWLAWPGLAWLGLAWLGPAWLKPDLAWLERLGLKLVWFLIDFRVSIAGELCLLLVVIVAEMGRGL